MPTLLSPIIKLSSLLPDDQVVSYVEFLLSFEATLFNSFEKKETNLMDHRFANFSRAGNPNDMKVKNVFKKMYLVLVICF